MAHRGHPTGPRFVVDVEPELMAASRSRHPSSHAARASQSPEAAALATDRDRAAPEAARRQAPTGSSVGGPTSSAIGNRAPFGPIKRPGEVARPPERVAGLPGLAQDDG